MVIIPQDEVERRRRRKAAIRDSATSAGGGRPDGSYDLCLTTAWVVYTAVYQLWRAAVVILLQMPPSGVQHCSALNLCEAQEHRWRLQRMKAELADRVQSEAQVSRLARDQRDALVNMAAARRVTDDPDKPPGRRWPGYNPPTVTGARMSDLELRFLGQVAVCCRTGPSGISRPARRNTGKRSSG